MTLIELMVALVIGLFIALAACAALIVARQGFTAVDAAGQLRENARFTADLMQRIVVQAGFNDVANGDIDRDQSTGNPPDDANWPGLRGLDNAWYAGGDPSAVVSGSRSSNLGNCGSAVVTDTSCNNFSDVLVVRFQGSSQVTNPPGPADGSMINCAGLGEPFKTPDPTTDARAYAVFHLLRAADGEPALVCSYRDPVSGVFTYQTLVKGVEDFQVLYGTDGVTPGAAPPAGNTGMHGTVDRYLTATQLDAGSAAGTLNNWRRVRSVRIGLLFRGDVNSMSTRQANTWDMRNGGILASPARGGFTSATADPNGDSLTVQADGRLRQTMVFTIHLRNQQGFDVCTNPASPC